MYLFHAVLVVKDVDLVRHILVKDFDHFVDRSVSLVSGRSGNLLQKGDLVDRIWAKQMISAKGEEWKNMRSAFSPIFTPGKMKAMLIFMQETCKELLSGIGKKHALKKYDQFILYTSCFWGSTGSNITPVVQFHKIFVTEIMNK